MGLYIRKAVRVGPFRFNLSKSGIGVSSGVTGFRVGTGPRGHYVHMGRGGVYYRKSLSSKPRAPRRRSADIPHPGGQGGNALLPDATHEQLQEIGSGDAGAMVDSSSRTLVEELNAKRKRLRLAPGVLIAGLGLAWYLHGTGAGRGPVITILILTVVGAIIAAYRDVLRKSTVMLYDIEGDLQRPYETLHETFSRLADCGGRWRIDAQGRVKDRKYHAGAGHLVRRNPVQLALRTPPYVKSNILAPSVPCGTKTLYFFPDRVLVFDSRDVGAVSYDNLSVEVTKTQFIEEQSVPKDAAVVGYTWKYVNKKGGPDRRFKDNRKLPIALYYEMHFSSGTGLNETFQFSSEAVAKEFVEALNAIVALSRAGDPRLENESSAG